MYNLNSRKVYLDNLRFLASFFVIVIHVAAQRWGSVDVSSFNWNVYNFYDGIARFCVPIFVMISGAVFLGKKIPLYNILKKYIARLVIVYFMWSLLYALIEQEKITSIVASTIMGHYHLWFLPMIIGCYLCLPIINKVVEDELLEKYFLVLSGVFAFLIPTVNDLINNFGNTFLQKANSLLNYIVNNMYFHLPLGYVGYFVMGHYLANKNFKKGERIILYIGGIFGTLATIFLTRILSIQEKSAQTLFYRYISLNVMMSAIFLFVLAKNIDIKIKYNFAIEKVSLGIYLIHPLLIENLKLLPIDLYSMNPVYGVLLISVIIWLCSAIIVSLMNRLPFVKNIV